VKNVDEATNEIVIDDSSNNVLTVES